MKKRNLNEFTVHLVSSDSMKIFPQNTSFKNYFNEEINLEGDWRVALSEIIFPAKVNQLNKSDLEIFSSETLIFMRKVFHLMIPNHTEENELSLELIPMKTVTIV